MNRLAKIAGIVFLIYAGFSLLMFLFQRHILFPRTLIPAPEAPAFKSDRIERWWIEASFGKVEAWYLPAEAAGNPAPAVIFAHGNGELIDHWVDTLAGFPALGFGLLLVEYPGYGRSGGTPSQTRIAEAFDLAYDRLAARRDVDPARIVFFGRSLGGGAVCDLALRRPAKALILMSAFKSVYAFAARYLAPPFLIRDPFDNLAALRRYPGPVLVIHGRHDEIVPFGHGEALAAASPNARMVVYEAGHNDCPPDWEPFWDDVGSFLKSAGLP